MSWSKPLKKKDLTGILELASMAPPPKESEIEDPFAVNVMPNIEQVDEFASIDTLGMMDHELPVETEVSSDLTEAISPIEEVDPFAATALSEEEKEGVPDSDQELTQIAPPINEFSLPESTYDVVSPPAVDAAPPMEFFEDIKNYSERSREGAFEPDTKSPFHLSIEGDFDPFSRDKLLLFITENPIGINSSDLDLQIKSGRALFPRISEYAGIKLIQDLRDSGLSFKLYPSSRDADETIPATTALKYHFQTELPDSKNLEIPVLPAVGYDPKAWRVIDSIQMVQYLRAEILEVEKSELFQELVERMLQAMKRKAKLKGADAMSELKHELTPLRLPSQYQIELKANLVKKL